MDGPSSQLDLYTPPNNYQIFYISYKPLSTNQTLIGANLFWSTIIYLFILAILALSVLKNTLHNHN